MADLTLTPGSRRKLLRHIDEGLHIGDLARKMDISLIAVRKIILADDELKDACLCNGTLSPEGIFTLGKPIEVPIPSGMNPDFVKKVWAKRRKAEQQKKLQEKKKAVRKAVVAVKKRIIEVKKPENQVQSGKQVIEYWASIHGLRYFDLTGISRNAYISEVRQMAMYEVRRQTSLTTTQIGKLFNRHHSTIVHAAQKLGEKFNHGPATQLSPIAAKVLDRIPDGIQPYVMANELGVGPKTIKSMVAAFQRAA
ncbi:helix-turn-helix domain-containing protein [Brucella intermedia]|uniref:helix-turn-helix domain-containing protein n=1 Tax=Brucella intermedia TaxID=94625 RepID=UPI00158994C4|nr:helix-turn-helix domain-containing protein [Brucella intermedia]